MLEHRVAYPAIPQPDGLSQIPIPKIRGIYFLWAGANIVYVGQSVCIRSRIGDHLGEAAKKFDGISYIAIQQGSLARAEQYYIERLLPKYNRCGFSHRCRKERSWGILPPPLIAPVTTDEDVARALKLTEAQFKWLMEQPNCPRKRRLPRKHLHVWNAQLIEKWVVQNRPLLEQARAA